MNGYSIGLGDVSQPAYADRATQTPGRKVRKGEVGGREEGCHQAPRRSRSEILGCAALVPGCVLVPRATRRVGVGGSALLTLLRSDCLCPPSSYVETESPGDGIRKGSLGDG